MKIDKNYFLKILKEEFEEVSVEGLPYNLDIIKKNEKTYLKISYDMDLFLYTALEMKFVSKFVKDNVLNDVSDLKIVERYVEFFNDGIVNEVNNVDKKEVYIPFKEIFPTLSVKKKRVPPLQRSKWGGEFLSLEEITKNIIA